MTPFTYELPTNQIAQRPVHPYDSARLLLVDRAKSAVSESVFSQLPQSLRPQDLLVFNDSKVIPARLFGKLEPHGAEFELLLIKEHTPDSWVCLGKPLRKIKPGSLIRLSAEFYAQVIERSSEYEILVRFNFAGRELRSQVDTLGLMPIPPYIRGGRSDQEDRTDYQTFFARNEGSVAAPTASLHFTPELVQKILGCGVQIEYLTLHVGTASFLPLHQSDDGSLKPPSEERYLVSQRLIDSIQATKSRGGRVIAVGTTAVRALESFESANPSREPSSTALFIRPPYAFKVVDAMITNFHQPSTTHLLLVQAFLGRELIEQSYEYALKHNFRFLSYGDGMLIT